MFRVVFPDRINGMNAAATRRTQPRGLFVAVLHFVRDAGSPYAIGRASGTRRHRDSDLVISHATTDPSPQPADDVSAVYAATRNPA